MKQGLFSRAKGCECHAWELDKTTRLQHLVLHPGEEDEVCLSVCIALFTSKLGDKNERINIGNGEQGIKNGEGKKEQGTGSKELATGSGEQGTENRKQRTENRERETVTGNVQGTGKTDRGKRDRGTGNREQRPRNREQGTEKGRQGPGNSVSVTGRGEREKGNIQLFKSIFR